MVINPANYQQPRFLKPRSQGWWKFLLGVLVLGLIASFFVTVYMEVDRRNREVKELLGLTKPQNSLMSGDLVNQLKDSMGTAGTATTTSQQVTSTVAAATLSPQRKLAEKLNRPKLGNASSTLVIVEFADFECPICLEEFPIIRTLTNKYPQDVLFIFRNYPVKNENSQMLALAGFCANEQGKFWQFHDKLFAAQGKIATDADLEKIVVSAGLSLTKMKDCIQNNKYNNLLLEDTSDALDLGVAGTPTFFINGSKLEGAVPLATWEEIIKKHKELISTK
jgi:protein-disulfide isomerase